MYYLATVTFEKLLENGAAKKTTEQHLIEANSYTQAETYINEEIKPAYDTPFAIKSIKQAKLAGLLAKPESLQQLYTAKTQETTLTGKGVERTRKYHYIIQADAFQQAQEALTRVIHSETIISIQLSNIVEFHVAHGITATITTITK